MLEILPINLVVFVFGKLDKRLCLFYFIGQIYISVHLGKTWYCRILCESYYGIT